MRGSKDISKSGPAGTRALHSMNTRTRRRLCLGSILKIGFTEEDIIPHVTWIEAFTRHNPILAQYLASLFSGSKLSPRYFGHLLIRNDWQHLTIDLMIIMHLLLWYRSNGMPDSETFADVMPPAPGGWNRVHWPTPRLRPGLGKRAYSGPLPFKPPKLRLLPRQSSLHILPTPNARQ